MDARNFNPQVGMDVIGSDGEKIGEIDAIEQNYLVVRKGLFFPTDHFIPFSAVSAAQDNEVVLNVTKDDALNQQWDTMPEGTTGFGGEAYAEPTADYRDDANDVGYVEGIDRDGTYIEDAGNNDRGGYVADVETETATGGYVADVDSDRTATDYVERDRTHDHDDHTTIELTEEELTATKREVDRGAVRIDKDVIQEERTIDVPVREEEVNITRRHVDRDATGDHAFEEGTIEVPVRGEVVDVEKRARVVEEIDIDKTATERTERVTDTVRREEVHIDGENVDAETRSLEGDDYVDGTYDDDRSLMDKAKDAVDRDNDGRIG